MSKSLRDHPNPNELHPGDEHYRAYVGPPGEYDVVGASQFRLLTALGLREHHHCLDFGCGSLRLGRILIPYLAPGHYFGIEPNTWLIDDVIRMELGQEIIAMRRPCFSDTPAFDCFIFGRQFDYIVAQSIFSHAHIDLFSKGLTSAANALTPRGLLLATFVPPSRADHPGKDGVGWVYPGVCSYSSTEVEELCHKSGLAFRLLPWRHPRQIWFAASHSTVALPPEAFDVHLGGPILGVRSYF